MAGGNAMGIETARPSGFGGLPRFLFVVGIIVDLGMI
jgi:hypothetical protein